MPKSHEPRSDERHPPADAAAEQTPTERARAIIERQLALKQHGQQGLNGGLKAGAVHKPGKGGYSPAPIRPGGRGRRG